MSIYAQLKKQAAVCKLNRLLKQGAPALSPTTTALAGAGLGAGLGGLYSLLTSGDDTLGSMLGGGFLGGVAGAVGNPLINLAGHRAGWLSNTASSNKIDAKALKDVLPSGYADDARRNAEKYRKYNSGTYFMQKITPDALERRVDITRNDETNRVGNRLAAATYDPIMDQMNIPVGGEWGLSHELTHAAQPIPTAKDDVKHLLANLQNRDAIRAGFPDMDHAAVDYYSKPAEIEAYLADIKRDYFKNTGRHVTNTQEAAAAIKSKLEDIEKRLQSRRSDMRVPGFEGELYNRYQREKTLPDRQKTLPRMMRRLEELMPGLVNNQSNVNKFVS